MRFALISDQHFGPAARFEGKLRKLSHEAGRLTRDFASWVERESVDVIVNLGDVVEDESPEADRDHYREFLGLVEPLGKKMIHVAGNHDFVHLREQDLRDLWWHDGPLYYVKRVSNVTFVVLHTLETKDVAVHLPDEQFTWLESELERAESPVIVLMHHPASEMVLTGNRWFENAPHICRLAERRKLRSLLEASGKVVAVFNGHVHWNHLDVIAGIPYFTLQSLTENLDDDAPGRPAAAWALAELTTPRLLVRVFGAEALRYQFELGPRLTSA